MIKTSDGGYMISTVIEKKGKKNDILIIKTNSKGIKQWSKTFGNELDDVIKSIIQTADGGYMLAGSTEQNEKGIQDFWLIKLDKEGNL